MISNSKIEILLIEDNPIEARLIIDLFDEIKLNNIITIQDGQEALNYLYKKGKYKNSQTPSLILLELKLPKLDGNKILKIIKHDEKLKIIPIIILTLFSNTDEIINAYSNYASSVLIKPDNYEEFEDMIHSLEDFWLKKAKLPEYNLKN